MLFRMLYDDKLAQAAYLIGLPTHRRGDCDRSRARRGSPYRIGGA
jgi:hypothetical protein